MEKHYLGLMQEIAETFTKGCGSTIIQMKSFDSSMNKGTKNNRNPFLGRVIQVTTYSGYVMGTDYQASIENTSKRLNGEDATANLKGTWHHPIPTEDNWDDKLKQLPRWFSTNKTEDKFYLKIQVSENQVAHKVEKVLYLDGHIATEEEVAEIKAWEGKKSNTLSSTQRELGIDEDHKRVFLLPQLETIVYIEQNGRVLRPMKRLGVQSPLEVKVMVTV